MRLNIISNYITSSLKEKEEDCIIRYSSKAQPSYEFKDQSITIRQRHPFRNMIAPFVSVPPPYLLLEDLQFVLV